MCTPETQRAEVFILESLKRRRIISESRVVRDLRLRNLKDKSKAATRRHFPSLRCFNNSFVSAPSCTLRPEQGAADHVTLIRNPPLLSIAATREDESYTNPICNYISSSDVDIASRIFISDAESAGTHKPCAPLVLPFAM